MASCLLFSWSENIFEHKVNSIYYGFYFFFFLLKSSPRIARDAFPNLIRIRIRYANLVGICSFLCLSFLAFCMEGACETKEIFKLEKFKTLKVLPFHFSPKFSSCYYSAGVVMKKRQNVI